MHPPREELLAAVEAIRKTKDVRGRCTTVMRRNKEERRSLRARPWSSGCGTQQQLEQHSGSSSGSSRRETAAGEVAERVLMREMLLWVPMEARSSSSDRGWCLRLLGVGIGRETMGVLLREAVAAVAARRTVRMRVIRGRGREAGVVLVGGSWVWMGCRKLQWAGEGG
jgi:hypothetical protein